MIHAVLILALAVPHTLTINGEPWRVLEKDRIHGTTYLLGVTDCPIRLIELRKNQNDAEKADTLLHEVLHALTCDATGVHNDKWNNDEDSHEGIYWAAPRLLEFIQDNPEVVGYLATAGNKRK